MLLQQIQSKLGYRQRGERIAKAPAQSGVSAGDRWEYKREEGEFHWLSLKREQFCIVWLLGCPVEIVTHHHQQQQQVVLKMAKLR